MARRGMWYERIAGLACLLATGCTQTSRVDDNLSTTALVETRKAVAVMRVGAASPYCINVAVLLGVRQGDAFRRHQAINVTNVRSLVEPAVAEVELDLGEYHLVAYRCQTKGGIKTVSAAAEPGTYTTSFASFRLEPGEVVNVGYLHVEAWRQGRNTFGRPTLMDVEVTDWPLAELERYKARRPHIYAQMKTRLMTVTPQGQGPPTSQDCARLKALKAEGKVQELPPRMCQAVGQARGGRSCQAGRQLVKPLGTSPA
jgi:hypothetical protein